MCGGNIAVPGVPTVETLGGALIVSGLETPGSMFGHCVGANAGFLSQPVWGNK